MSATAQSNPTATPSHPGFSGQLLQRIFSTLSYALQPVVEMGTGVVYGYEAQVRNCAPLGAETVADLFDEAERLGYLPDLEIGLLRKAIESFSKLRMAKGTKLFFKLDGRGLGEHGDPRMDMSALLGAYNLHQDQICLEFSERHQQTFTDLTHHAINDLRQSGFMVALDDFGRGSSELRLLHDLSPDYVKIDRFFLNGIDSDPGRKLFVTTVANLSHVLGSRVIAEGIETEQELKACHDAGCDLIQGHFIAEPFEDPRAARLFYRHIRIRDPHGKHKDEQARIRNELLTLPTVQADASMTHLLDLFVRDQNASIIPVLGANQEPRGIIHERDLKAYLYAGGPDTDDAKAALDFPLRSFVRGCPIADIDSNADMLLVTFASSINSDGIIITKNFRYAGFLSATSLLKIIHEKRLLEAQDQNPLTGLPGNATVTDFVSETAYKYNGSDRHLCYLDFDNFKPFNDHFGYRQGDRAIILFSELLRRHVRGGETFHGHIGGDDFFAGFLSGDQTEVVERLRALQQAFALDVESFYDAKHRSDGFITSRDRFGMLRQYPLLQCSMAVLTLPDGLSVNIDLVNEHLADLKAAAKRSETGLVCRTLTG